MKTKIIVLLVFVQALFSCSSMNLISLSEENEMGKKMELQIASDPVTYPIMSRARYPESYAYIDRIFSNIMHCGYVNYTNYFNWEIFLIDANVQNAFACPGGKVYVYTGLIEYLDDEAELAGVLAHEIAHVHCRHSTQQLSRQYGVSFLVNLVTSTSGSYLVDLVANIAGTGAVMSFSRSQESQADLLAVQFLCGTSYDPLRMSGFFEQMVADGSAGNTSGMQKFFSTHPSSPDRVAKIHKEWQRLGSKRGERYADRYAQFKRALKNRR